jgi:hypothetical protein
MDLGAGSSCGVGAGPCVVLGWAAAAGAPVPPPAAATLPCPPTASLLDISSASSSLDVTRQRHRPCQAGVGGVRGRASAGGGASSGMRGRAPAAAPVRVPRSCPMPLTAVVS